MLKIVMVIRTAVVAGILLSAIGILSMKQNLVMEQERSDPLLIQQLNPINPKLIEPFLLGHEGFYADVFWIEAIQHSVDHHTKGLFNYLRKMIELITDLDPRFTQVYIWANSALEFCMESGVRPIDKVNAANKILSKGWEFQIHDPIGWNYYSHYWMIPQLLGFNYGFELKDKEKALEYTQALMNIPDLPAYMKTWAAGLYRESNEKEKGIGYLETLFAAETLQAQIQMTDDRLVKERLMGKLLAFYKKLNSDEYGYQRMEEIRKQVEHVVSTWREKYDFIPFSFYTLLHQHSNDVSISDEIYFGFFPNLAEGNYE